MPRSLQRLPSARPEDEVQRRAQLISLSAYGFPFEMCAGDSINLENQLTNRVDVREVVTRYEILECGGHGAGSASPVRPCRRRSVGVSAKSMQQLAVASEEIECPRGAGWVVVSHDDRIVGVADVLIVARHGCHDSCRTHVERFEGGSGH